MKRIVSLLLSFAMLVCISSCFNISAFAITSAEGEEYELLSDGTAELTYCYDADEMYVSAEIDGYTVSKIGSTAFAGKAMTKITIPGTVKEIADHAFDRCNLSTVIMQDGVEKIGNYAFTGCAPDLKINIPSSVKEIGRYAVGFDIDESGNPVKTNATIVGIKGSAAEDYAVENGIEFAAVDETSFSYDYVLLEDGTVEITSYFGSDVDLKIPSKIGGYTVSGIASLAIFDNDTIESITVPGTVKTLYNQAIDSCDSLKEVILEEGVESLFWIAIVDCPALERVVVPQSVTLIEEYAIGYGISSKGGTEEKVGDPVIYGYENSSAQKYAEEYGIKFALIDDVIVYDKSSLTYVIGSNEGAVIYCIYALSDFESVAIDGRIVDSANYTLTEGSTILTFKTDFLDTLKPGKHTVTLNYTNDSVNTVLTIENGDGSKSVASKQMRSPDTGTSAVGMIAALGAVIIASAATTVLKKKVK